MNILLWALAINWGLPLAIYTLYALLFWLVARDYEFRGWTFPCFKLQLSHKGVEKFHAAIWKDWYGHGGLLWIFYRDALSDADDEWVKKTIKHEARHALQWLVLGLMMYVLYMGHMLFILLFQKDKHPYLDCWFERDARRHAGQLVDIPRDRWPQGTRDRWPWW